MELEAQELRYGWCLHGPDTSSRKHECIDCIRAALEAVVAEERERIRSESIVAHCVNREGAPPPVHDCYCVVCNAVRKEREACAMLHESINNDCDKDRYRQSVTGCGCGAMGAVIEYRDAIRARGLEEKP